MALGNFDQAVDGSKARNFSGFVLAKVLAADVAETFSVPSGANRVIFASTGDFHAQPFTTAPADIVTNGAFASDTGWTKGTGWTIAAGVGTSDASQTGNAELEQAPTTTLIEGQAYLVTFTVTAYTAGNVRVNLGGGLGTNRASAASFSEVIIAGATANIGLRADLDFAGSVDNLVVTPVAKVPVDETIGKACEMIKAASPEDSRTRICTGLASISVVASATNLVTASFFTV